MGLGSLKQERRESQYKKEYGVGHCYGHSGAQTNRDLLRGHVEYVSEFSTQGGGERSIYPLVPVLIGSALHINFHSLACPALDMCEYQETPEHKARNVQCT